MKLMIVSLLLNLSLNVMAQTVLASNPDTSLSALRLETVVNAKIDYNETMNIESISVERLPTNFDPDETPTSFYCLTTVVASIGEVALTGTVENNILERKSLPLKAIVFNETKDDGQCKLPQFSQNVWYDMSLQVGQSVMSFKGRKRNREYQLDIYSSGILGKVIFKTLENGAPVVLGFDFNNGKVVRAVNELEMAWAIYYKTTADPRMMLQEQGRFVIAE